MTEIDVSAELFSQAAVLLMVGMGFVFAFLSLLIFVIKYILAPLSTRFPDSVPAQKHDSNSKPSAVIAAISVAVNKYRQKHTLNK